MNPLHFHSSIACGLAIAGCTLDFDTVGPRGTGGGATSGGGGSTSASPNGGDAPGGGSHSNGGASSGGEAAGGGPSCASEGGQCTTVPASASGPFLLGPSPGTACGTLRVAGGLSSVSPFTAPSAVCGCTCKIGDSDCDVLQQSSSNDCADLASPFNPLHGICNGILNAPPSIHYPLGNASGTCVSNGEPPVAPPWSFNDPVVLCDDGLAPGCDAGQACIPASSDRYCIEVPTAIECGGAFAVEEGLIEMNGVVDARTCICECEPTITVLCLGPTITVYSDVGCQNSLSPTIDSGCVDVGSGNIRGVNYMPNPMGTCAQNPSPQGTVSPGPVRKLCCNR